MIDGETIFRLALAPSAGIIWSRYFSWPAISIVLCLLIVNKFKPVVSIQAYLPYAWWVLILIGLLVLGSLLLALVAMPSNDLELRTIMYYSIVLSLPTLIPFLVAIFFKPNLH